MVQFHSLGAEIYIAERNLVRDVAISHLKQRPHRQAERKA
jgi:hypothetical protein